MFSFYVNLTAELFPHSTKFINSVILDKVLQCHNHNETVNNSNISLPVEIN